MKIFLPKSRLLEVLFPDIKDYNNLTEDDILRLKNAYSFGSYHPDIEVKKQSIEITFDDDSLLQSQKDLQELVKLSDKRAFDKALQKANELIQENPAASEYHRIKGQILSEQGHPNEAIDSLIEAVRLNPENSSALIMLGNIYAKERSDADTALTFYERVLETNPENHLALNNIGGNLPNLGKYDDAKRYFDLAHKLEPNYPHTLYGLALLESKREYPEKAFEYARQTFFKLNLQKQHGLYRQNLSLIKQESRKSMRGGYLAELISPYKANLEEKAGKESGLNPLQPSQRPPKLNFRKSIIAIFTS